MQNMRKLVLALSLTVIPAVALAAPSPAWTRANGNASLPQGLDGNFDCGTLLDPFAIVFRGGSHFTTCIY